jgi:hypothetical protein
MHDTPANTPLLIDGLNVAYWGGPPPTLRLPFALFHALRQQGASVFLVFDASTPYRCPAEEVAAYHQALANCPDVVRVPSGQSADRWLLRRATQTGGRIISRDHFADHRRRYRRLIDDPTRRFGGFIASQQLHVSALGLIATLPADIGCGSPLLQGP